MNWNRGVIDKSREPIRGRESGLPGRARLLFVGGCQRSGTTAFADYMNQHPKVLVGVERYGRIPTREITPDLFTFERLLDYREETVRPRDYYAGLLEEKSEGDLEWIGDKNPNYVLRLNLLSRNNPGARFIVLHRPVEEVAESWGIGARDNPGDPWRGRENGFERGVQAWNRALNKTREFIERGAGPPVLIIDYHDFFHRNERCVSLISRFLDLEFGEGVLASWQEMSASFERDRRTKNLLTEEQAAFVRKHKDRAAEDWMLRRIDAQWRSLEKEPANAEALYRAIAIEDSPKGWDEAREEGSLERRISGLEEDIAEESRASERLRRQNEELRLLVRDLDEQLRNVRGSKTWRLLDGLKRLGIRARSLGRGSR